MANEGGAAGIAHINDGDSVGSVREVNQAVLDQNALADSTCGQAAHGGGIARIGQIEDAQAIGAVGQISQGSDPGDIINFGGHWQCTDQPKVRGIG